MSDMEEEQAGGAPGLEEVEDVKFLSDFGEWLTTCLEWFDPQGGANTRLCTENSHFANSTRLCTSATTPTTTTTTTTILLLYYYYTTTILLLYYYYTTTILLLLLLLLLHLLLLHLAEFALGKV